MNVLIEVQEKCLYYLSIWMQYNKTSISTGYNLNNLLDFFLQQRKKFKLIYKMMWYLLKNSQAVIK